MAVAACAMFAACEDNEDALTTQRQRIVSYLTSSHVPQLIAEEDVENSLEPIPNIIYANIFKEFSVIGTST